MIGASCFCAVCLSVCLFVCLSVVNFNLCYNFWTIRDREFIFGMHTPLMMFFQMKSRSITLSPWLWPWSINCFLEVVTSGRIVFNKHTLIFGMCALWPWHWRYDLGSMTWHTLWSWTTTVWNIIQMQLTVMRYDPDTDFGHVGTVTLTLEIWHWVKVMTYPWVIDYKYVHYYPDPTWQLRVMAQTAILDMCDCDLDIRNMSLGQDHDTSLGHGQ